MVQNNQNKGYIIFDQQIAGLLMFFKHKLQFVRPDKYENTKNIFVFENTESLIKDLDYIKINRKNIEKILNK